MLRSGKLRKKERKKEKKARSGSREGKERKIKIRKKNIKTNNDR